MSRAPFLLLVLAACAPPGPEAVARVPGFLGAEIEVDAAGRCWARPDASAVATAVLGQEPATRPDLTDRGTPLADGTAGPDGFETPCPPAYTLDFVETLQRALRARGHYAGPVNGRLDAATGRAVRDFQRGEGLDSPILSLAAARRLGIVPLSPEGLAAR